MEVNQDAGGYSLFFCHSERLALPTYLWAWESPYPLFVLLQRTFIAVRRLLRRWRLAMTILIFLLLMAHGASSHGGVFAFNSQPLTINY